MHVSRFRLKEGVLRTGFAPLLLPQHAVVSVMRCVDACVGWRRSHVTMCRTWTALLVSFLRWLLRALLQRRRSIPTRLVGVRRSSWRRLGVAMSRAWDAPLVQRLRLLGTLFLQAVAKCRRSAPPCFRVHLRAAAATTAAAAASSRRLTRL